MSDKPYRPRYQYTGGAFGDRVPVTYTPCQGCGETRGRPKDKLCTACQRLIADGNAARAEHARNAARGVGVYDYPAQPHWVPRYQHAGAGGGSFGNAAAEDAVRRLMFRLVWALAAPVAGTIMHDQLTHLINRSTAMYLDSGPGDGRKLLTMPTDLAELLIALDNAIAEWTHAAYEDGVRYGRRLLAGLADGTVSVDELNARGIRQRPVEPR